jgi:hypothetical protein
MKNTDGVGEPSTPRVNGKISTLLQQVRNKYVGDSKVKDFITRMSTGGDLNRELVDGLCLKVNSGWSNTRIAGEIIARMDKIWRSAPPSPDDLLYKVFASGDEKKTGPGTMRCSADESDDHAADVDRVMTLSMPIAIKVSSRSSYNKPLTINLLILRRSSPDRIRAAETVLAAIGSIDGLDDESVSAKIRDILIKP